MIYASKGWCLINQMIEQKDSLSEYVINELNIKQNAHDPHNDRNAVQDTFNFLWSKGFDPEITYLKEQNKKTLSINEAVERCTFRFGKAAEDKNINLEEILAKYAIDNNIIVESNVTFSTILWKV